MAVSNRTAINKIKFSPVDIEARKKLDFKAGDTIRVWSKIQEEKASKKGDGTKFRLQAFEGMVIGRKHGSENGATFTVRRVASGVGVERIFPIYSPMVDKIEVIKKAKARRSKLYYVRVKAVKDVRRKMRSVTAEPEAEVETPAAE
ncbi:MAG: 50S ribosomal protein L19 [Candidatus Pacebacteria bacterium]|nr:50S ribosomal protein L19 [Candidatus Paceibacterota bacterium]